jgi:hypothetical protein
LPPSTARSSEARAFVTNGSETKKLVMTSDLNATLIDWILKYRSAWRDKRPHSRASLAGSTLARRSNNVGSELLMAAKSSPVTLLRSLFHLKEDGTRVHLSDQRAEVSYKRPRRSESWRIAALQAKGRTNRPVAIQPGGGVNVLQEASAQGTLASRTAEQARGDYRGAGNKGIIVTVCSSV